MFTPMMGVCFGPTRVAALRNVPSPPMDITKSASKLLPSNTPSTLGSHRCADVMKSKNVRSTYISASWA